MGHYSGICAIKVLNESTVFDLHQQSSFFTTEMIFKKQYLFISYLLFTCQIGFGQTMDISLFNGKSKAIKTQYQQLKQIKKERLNDIKERKKAYRALKDSLHEISSDSLQINSDSLKRWQQIQKQHYIYTGQLYDLDEVSQWDTPEKAAKERLLKESESIISGNRHYNKYGSYHSEFKKHRAELKSLKDSLKGAEGISELEKDYLIDRKKQEFQQEYGNKLEALGKGLAQNSGLESPELPGDKLDKLKQANQSISQPVNKEGAINKAKSQTKDYFADKGEALSGAMDKAQSLKKKYSKVLDSNDLSTATKRNSLKDKSFGERLIFGGTFQIHIDQNSAIDLNPELSYNINKDFSIGLGGTYQVNANTEEFFRNLKERQVVGYRAFIEHKLFKSFFFHGEFEGLNGKVDQATADSPQWHNSFLAGLERRFKVKRNLEGQFSVLYNFSHSSNPLYDSPWTIRFGFNFLKNKSPKYTLGQ